MVIGQDRPAISTRALAVLVIVVVLVGGGIGVYYPRPASKAPASSTTSQSSSSSSSTTSSAPSTSTTSSTTTSSETSTFTPTLALPLFNFTLVSAPQNILIAAGQVLNYSSVILIPRPNSLQGQAVLNAGIGSELVVLNATVPDGMYIHFFGSTFINTIYEEADAGSVMETEMQLVAPPTIQPGNYTVTIVGSSGALAVDYTFTVSVVKYLIIAQYQTFSPRNITVPAGTTVYWINLSTDRNQPYDVVFKTINVHSPTLQPTPAFDSFSYTFTTPGYYPYYSAYLAATMQGSVTVTG